jgi:hypothetical protein
MEFVPLQDIVKVVKFTKLYGIVPLQDIVKGVKFTKFYGTFTSPKQN